ncbi:glycosyltransferase family 39 protein [Kitasatospora sp. MAP5-34]|uniref:glycosyltransferase family 39 protein n=1 Tax=Kitasatospora sp. MAP5-34 TaxID=3035102 RepID=UPI0024757979|nr:glycosyltransferase family 39 protein [Kitasatospora sp. MAP5-34]MDH6578106.1 mannosyltransferase [Kitasatospora sp. MAP5-34]
MTATSTAEIQQPGPATAGPGTDNRPGDRAKALFERTFWLWPALLTLYLGVHVSWQPELWRDELATWSAATRSTGQLLDMLKNVDAVSGAYYLLMHFWISAFGDTPTVLRLPSALAMAGAAVFVALAARKLFGVRTAVVSGLLFAVVPSISRYAQEARSYAFVLLTVAAATWLLLRALERPSVLRWLPYAACVALAGLFHMVSLVFLCGHAVIVLMRWWRGRDRWLLLGFPAAVLVAMLPVLPLVLLGQKQVGRQISWLHTPTLATFVDYWHGLFGSALVSGCFLALAAIPAGWTRGRRPAFEVGVLAALPILVTWLVSQGQTAYFFERYQLYTVPAWAILAGAGLSSLRPRALTAAGLVVVALLGIPDQQKLRIVTSHEVTDGHAAARIIAKEYRPGDGFVPARGDWAWMMLDYETEYYLPRGDQLKDVFTARTALQRNDLYTAPCPDPATCLGDTSRIWVVTMGQSDDPYANLPKAQVAALQAAYTPTEVKHVRGLTVSLLERRH